MTDRPLSFVPALGYAVLTPLYDLAVCFGTPERRIRTWLRNQVAPGPLLDFGCGTGTFLALFSTEEAEGIDADPRMVARCLGKNLRVQQLREARLPFPDATFRTVTATWVFQHFPEEEARHFFREISRILQPGGCFWLGDWGPPRTPAQRFMTRLTQLVDRTQNGFGPAGQWPEWLRQSGFRDVSEEQVIPTRLGTFYAWKCLPDVP